MWVMCTLSLLYSEYITVLNDKDDIAYNKRFVNVEDQFYFERNDVRRSFTLFVLINNRCSVNKIITQEIKSSINF